MVKRKLSAVEVVEVKPSDVSLKPMLFEFQHGSLKSGVVDKLKCNYLIHRDNPENVVLRLNLNESVVEYRGNKLTQLCQRFLFIRNRRTNKARIIPVDQLFLSRYIESVAVEEARKYLDTSTVENLQVEIRDLNKEFGSQRMKRATALKSALKVDKEVMKHKMDQTVIGVNIDKETTQNDSPVLPKCNRNASRARDVYKLEDIFITNEVYESLTDLAQSVIERCPDSTDSEYSDFFKATINKLKSSLTLDKVKCLIFADALIKYLSTAAKKLNVKSVIYSVCPLSRHIRNVIISDFTIVAKTGRSRPTYMRDKAVCYIMVLLMIAFDYTLEEETVIKALPNVPFLKLTNSAKALGFTVMFGLKRWILKVPLPTFEKKSGRLRKKTLR